MSDPLRVVIGYDGSEIPGTYACIESILDHCSKPVSFILLKQDALRKDNIYFRDRTPDEATEFSRSRFLAPYLVDYKGPVLFMDGADMIVKADITELFESVPTGIDVALVKHEYSPLEDRKFNGVAPQSKYPRKLWSSLMLFWAQTQACQRLTPRYVSEASGAELHQLKWITPPQIRGHETHSDEARITNRVYGLDEAWNWIPGHSEPRVSFDDAKIVHWTQGTPAQGCKVPYQDLWEKYHKQSAEFAA
jgi:lipopolysaccharide biosynthesis glycosyltransferase